MGITSVVGERFAVGKAYIQLTPTTLRWSTLSAAQRGYGKIKIPSLWLAIERVVGRSNDQVSQLCDMKVIQSNNSWHLSQ